MRTINEYEVKFDLEKKSAAEAHHTRSKAYSDATPSYPNDLKAMILMSLTKNNLGKPQSSKRMNCRTY